MKGCMGERNMLNGKKPAEEGKANEMLKIQPTQDDPFLVYWQCVSCLAMCSLS